MSYLDRYPCCIGCPVLKYCGTMVSTTRLCHSIDDNMAEKESKPVLTMVSDENEAAVEGEEKIEMWDNITD